MSTIEWTDKTWNPTKGCSKVSPGCTNCYAIRMAARLEAIGNPLYQGVTQKNGKIQWSGKIALDENALELPLKWQKPRRIFVNSMSDLFHENIPTKFIKRIWKVMSQSPQHQYQILTKRPERMREVLNDSFETLENVWLGVSIESVDFLGRLSHLKKTKGKVKFVSFEPLLGRVGKVNLKGIHWAIVGGESGPGARTMESDWVKEIRTQCQEHNVAFFFKQWGGVHKKKHGRVLENRTWDEYPLN